MLSLIPNQKVYISKFISSDVLDKLLEALPEESIKRKKIPLKNKHNKKKSK